jgi:hypothetical protein
MIAITFIGRNNSISGGAWVALLYLIAIQPPMRRGDCSGNDSVVERMGVANTRATFEIEANLAANAANLSFIVLLIQTQERLWPPTAF